MRNRLSIIAIFISCFVFCANNVWAGWPKGSASCKVTDSYTIVTLTIEKGDAFSSFGVCTNSCLSGKGFCNGDTYIGISQNGKPVFASRLIRIDGMSTNTRYKTNKSDVTFTMYFERIPRGFSSIELHVAYQYFNGWTSSVQYNWWDWHALSVYNPYPSTPRVYYSESQMKDMILKDNDGICGIYEQSGDMGYKLACIKDAGVYKLVYMGADNAPSRNWPWSFGDVKASLRESATRGVFKGDWYMADKSIERNTHVFFSGNTMEIIIDGDKTLYIKMFPSTSQGGSSSVSSGEWSGTGFALNNGYLVTNHHVIDGAKTIKVRGIKGNSSVSYNARVVASDKNNDLAILKINDSRFNGFGTIPYRVNMTQAEVGENVYVLGYPLSQYLGDEVKLTNGIISSRSGYEGDISCYQMSAPVQPGNSGGPMFNEKGDIIGIVNAGVPGAENVGYAIKTSYLKALADGAGLSNIFPTTNTISAQSLTNKVKAIKQFVFYIECSSN